MRLSTFAALAIAAAALAGCKTFIQADLFTSDLLNAADGTVQRSPATLAFAVGSDPLCREKSAEAQDAVADSIEGAEFIGCTKYGFETVAEFRVPLTISVVGTNPDGPTSAFSIGVRSEDDGTLGILYRINPDAVRRIWEDLPEDMTRYQRFDPQYRLSAVINNDMREPVTILTDDVFADGTPLFDEGATTLDRRGQITIVLSDVANTAFGRHSTWVPVARIQTSE